MKTKWIPMIAVLVIGGFFFLGCEDEAEEEELTTADKLVGIWIADATQGDLGNATPASGSLAGAGWTSYELTLTADSNFSATGANPYDLEAYGGDGDGIVNYSGTYTIDDTKLPIWIDLTCTFSDLSGFFPTTAELQPLQNGIFELNIDDTELTIQYGAELAQVYHQV